MKSVGIGASTADGRPAGDRPGSAAVRKIAGVGGKRPLAGRSLARSDRDARMESVRRTAADAEKPPEGDWLAVGECVRVGDWLRVGDRLLVGHGDAVQTARSPPGMFNVAVFVAVFPLPVKSADDGRLP
jgi:hypothetical protein